MKDLLKQLNLTPQKILTDEEWQQAAREINAAMKRYSRETKAYFAMSKESARTAVLNF